MQHFLVDSIQGNHIKLAPTPLQKDLNFSKLNDLARSYTDEQPPAALYYRPFQMGFYTSIITKSEIIE